MAAHGTFFRQFYRVAACEVFGDLRNYHICLIYFYPVSHAKFEISHHTYIVYRRSAHGSSLQLDRIEHGYGIYQTCSGSAPLYLLKSSLSDLIFPFKSDGVFREFRRLSQRSAILYIVIYQHQSVRRYRIFFYPVFEPQHSLFQIVRICHAIFHTFEALIFQPFHLLTAR